MLINGNIYAQDGNLAGPELQIYPTGLLPGMTMDMPMGEKWLLNLKAGYNIVRHRDLGEHEDERGGGFGFSGGILYRLHEKWWLGARNDVWFNTIDWKDNIDQVNEISGTTDVTVIQPTAMLQYVIQKDDWFFRPSIAFGVEVNVKTEGSDVGEGPILLVGITASRVIGKK